MFVSCVYGFPSHENLCKYMILKLSILSLPSVKLLGLHNFSISGTVLLLNNQ